jgi:hypothetical protein
MNMKRLIQFACAIGLAVTTTGCGGGGGGDDSRALPKPTTGQTGVCSLYTAMEIEQWLGVPVNEGHTSGPGGTACQWEATSADDAFVQIQVIEDTSYWEKPDRAPGYRVLENVGQEGYASQEGTGWKAGALTDSAVVVVELQGGKANEASAIGLLRDTVDSI